MSVGTTEKISYRKKKLRQTKNDLKAMKLIYYNGIVGKCHLDYLVWPKNSGGRRLGELLEHDYLSKSHFCDEYGHKITSMYKINNAGIDFLSKHIEGPLRTPFDNIPRNGKNSAEAKYREYYQMVELLCQMIDQGLIELDQWLPARQAKIKYSLGHRLPFHAIIERDQGNDILFYIDNDGIVKLHNAGNTIKQIKFPNAKRFYILVDEARIPQLMKFFTRTYPEKDIYFIDVGLKDARKKDFTPLLKTYNDPFYFYTELTDRLSHYKGKIARLPSTSPSSPGPFKFYQDGKESYLTELISGSITNLEKLKMTGTTAVPPYRVYAYVPTTEFYTKKMKPLLPKKHAWLHLIARDAPKGKDFFNTSRS